MNLENWQRLVSKVGDTVSTVALGVAVVPYGIPTEYLPYLDPTTKATLFRWAVYAKIITGVWNAFAQKKPSA